jgi:hypothetical protein
MFNAYLLCPNAAHDEVGYWSMASMYAQVRADNKHPVCRPHRAKVNAPPFDRAVKVWTAEPRERRMGETKPRQLSSKFTILIGVNGAAPCER